MQVYSPAKYTFSSKYKYKSRLPSKLLDDTVYAYDYEYTYSYKYNYKYKYTYNYTYNYKYTYKYDQLNKKLFV